MKNILFLAFLFFTISVKSETIKLKSQWYPQAQFAGSIMALEKGFFTKDSLDVELLFSDGTDDIIGELKENKIQYGTAWLSETISKNNDKSLLNIMQILQQSSLMLISKKETGINKPSDLNGKKVRLWGGAFSIPFHAFIKKYKLKFEELTGTYNIDLFLSGACDVTSGMYFNEYNKMYLAGINFDEMNTILFSKDKDLNFPEDGLYITHDYQKTHKEEVISMRTAITKGWNYARKHQEETIKMVLDYCDRWKLKTNYAEQKWMLEKILEAAYVNKSFGELKIEQYYKVQEELIKQKIITKQTSYTDFYLGANND